MFALRTLTRYNSGGMIITRQREAIIRGRQAEEANTLRKGERTITKKEFEKLKNSIQLSEQGNGMVEVKTLMNRQQLDLMKALLFEDDPDNVDDIQSKLYEFGSTVHSTDYIGRRLFICLFHMVQGMKQQQLAGTVRS